MRSTIISIILFSLLLGGIIWNGIFVRQVSNTLTEYADTLVSPSDQELRSLEKYWEEKRSWIGLSVSGSYLDSVEKIIISLRSAYDLGNESEYQKNLALFRQAAETVGKAERVSIENIL